MPKKKRKKRRKLKKKFAVLFYLIIAVTISLVGYKYYQSHKTEIKDKIEVFKPKDDKEKIKKLQKEEYEKCMQEPFQYDGLENDFNAIFDKYNNSGIAIYFTEINNEYSYSLNPSKAYFSASTIKLLDVIYYVEKVRNGEFTGEETITYLAEDVRSYSPETKKHNINDEIPVTDLIKYVLIISDNSAHEMMARSFGTSNLNKYFKEKYNLNLHLTAKNPYESSFTANMGNEILKILYDLLQVDDEYTALIKESMDNDDVNSLNFDDKRFLHKYGEVSPYHNQLGIYDNENPYLITILTTMANKNCMEKVPALHKEIFNLYTKNLEEKNNYCDALSKEKHQLES